MLLAECWDFQIKKNIQHTLNLKIYLENNHLKLKNENDQN